MSRGVRWSALGVGLVFGFLLTASGLGDYDTIHDGLLLRDPYIFLMMASAMAVAFAGLAVLRRIGRTRYAGRLALPHHRIERRHIYGGVVFGLGFGVGATCPGMTIVMTTTAQRTNSAPRFTAKCAATQAPTAWPDPSSKPRVHCT